MLKTYTSFFKQLMLGLPLSLALFGLQAAHSQVVFTSGAGLTQTENFNTMGTSGSAALPSGWRWASGTSPVFSAGSATTTSAAGTTGSGALTSFSAGGTYNFASGVTASTTDRAVGFMFSGSAASPRSLMVQLQNNTGATMTGLMGVAFDYEKYRNGTHESDWTFYYSIDGSAWTAVPAGNQVYPADASVIATNPSTSVSKTGINISGLSIAAGDYLYLRWDYTEVGSSSSAMGLGVDNFSATAAIASGCTPPSQVGFNISSSVTTTSIGLGWSAPAGNILIVRRTGAAPVNVPVNGTVYSAGDTLGAGDTVVYTGSGASVTVNNLLPNTGYYFKAYSYDPTGFTGSTPCYNINNPAAIDTNTAACVSAQISGFTAGAAAQPTSQVLGWTLPVGAHIIILRKQGATTVTEVPVQGIAYTVGTTIGSSTVAYIGSDTATVITGLTAGTSYQYAAFAFDPTGYNNAPCYVTPGVTAGATTATCSSAAQISGLAAGTITTSSIALGWNTPAVQVLVLKRQGSPVTSMPVNGTVYTTGSVIGAEDTVIYAGSASGTVVANLLPATGYYFKAFAYDPTGNAGSTPCYNVSNPPALGPVTTSACTAAQVSALTSAQNGYDINLGWNLPAGTQVLILKQGGSTQPLSSNTLPVSGVTYSVNQVTGNNASAGGVAVSVAYIGSGSSTTITGLNTGNYYLFQAFAFDPTGYNGAPCYNLAGTVSTTMNNPPLDIKLTSFTAINKGIYNQLNWVVASEGNGDLYHPERSADGSNFEEMATIKATGNAGAYSYADTKPVAGTNYYRLRMNFVNGNVQYSPVVTVQVRTDGFSIATYPNPVKDNLHVQLYNADGEGTLRITDLSGRMLSEVKATAPVMDLNTGNLVPSTYFLQYTDGTHHEVLKIVK